MSVLREVTLDTAEKITLAIHNEGSGVAGVYTYDIAKQKVIEAATLTCNQGPPLQLKVDKE